MTDEFPLPVASRPLWLITLADLALLLVGFLVLVQATRLDHRDLAAGLREGFGAAPPPVEEPIPVAAAGLTAFAPGSAALAQDPAELVAWARAALADPRVSLRVAGSVDGTPADVDPVTRSGAVLAADRARAVAAALAAVAPGRMTVTTARPGRRQVVVTLAFTEPR
jgi:hypothetical protein